jgi:hypothetical protein
VSDKPESEEAADAAHEAVDAERLLPNEDPGSTFLEDAEHWRAVYDELLDAKASILHLTRTRIEAASEVPVRDELSLDETVMRAELQRLQRRFRFWRARAAELSGGE